MTRTFLIYASTTCSDPGNSNSIAFYDPQIIWVRVEEYRGGSDLLDYGERNARQGEVFVNSVALDYPERG